MDEDRIRMSDVPTGSQEGIAKQSPSAENLEVFPDFAWKMTSTTSLEMIFKNQDDMFAALEKCRSMRLPTVKAVAVDTNEERTTAGQATHGGDN